MRQGLSICLEGVAVCYRVPTERVVSFKEHMIRRLTGRVRYQPVWALWDVSLEVASGEVVGIIGPNGAGKSTLLKVIARVLRPTRGRVRVWGRVVPLIELGAGFHPELTGRENVYLNAAILGHSRQDTDACFSGIVEFAELGDFIDAPLRTYSTGMIARLGFAVATAWEPDILIVDEVLAVGDEAFQQKCRERIKAFRRRGVTVLLVSHNMNRIQSMCTRAIWLHQGRVRAVGPPAEVVRAYHASVERGEIIVPHATL